MTDTPVLPAQRLPKVTYFQWWALKQCSLCRRGAYIWKPATMRKLISAGLVEPHGQGFAVTAVGQQVLKEQHGGI